MSLRGDYEETNPSHIKTLEYTYMGKGQSISGVRKLQLFGVSPSKRPNNEWQRSTMAIANHLSEK